MSSVGAYQLEGLGIQLFEKIDGDYFSILGLPLLPLLDALRREAPSMAEERQVKRACVIGWPVAHSRSPVIHRYWLKLYGLDGAYEMEAVRA